MSGNSGSAARCEGWWEQTPYGRQSMEQLRLSFHEGSIRGSGTDIVGPFTFSGTLADHGGVAMRKQYVGLHSVDYLGTYDGEGVMSGQWQLYDLRGPWLIKIRLAEAEGAKEIKEIVPARV
jgi:hypothetical protein